VSYELAPHMVPSEHFEHSLYLALPPGKPFGKGSLRSVLALPPGKPFGKGSLRSVLVARRCLLRAVGALMLDLYLRSVRIIAFLG
jgi:hypothetical protein